MEEGRRGRSGGGGLGLRVSGVKVYRAWGC